MSDIKLYPAVDIAGGRAVRLLRGDFTQETVYADDPFVAVKQLVDEGANYLHMVDLDGARDGAPTQLDFLRTVCKELDVQVQYGGGLRNIAAVQAAFAAGADRVVIGTAALTEGDMVNSLLAEYGDRVVIALDSRGGYVATDGWLNTAQWTVEAAVETLVKRGAQVFLCTNIDHDGMLHGQDLDGLTRISRLLSRQGKLIASGGVGSLNDLELLVQRKLQNLDSVIVGKALYEQRFTLHEANRVLQGQE